MMQGIDAKGIDMGPEEGAGIIYSYYFIVFIFFGSFFFMNFFIGVIFMNFEEA